MPTPRPTSIHFEAKRCTGHLVVKTFLSSIKTAVRKPSILCPRAGVTRDSEELSKDIESSSRPKEKDTLRRKLIEALKARADAQAAGVGGVFYKTYAFQHE